VNDKFMNRMKNVSKQVRTRKSAVDMHKLQEFLEKTTTNGTLKEKINNTAISDGQFNDFLKNFKASNKEYANVLDFSRFYDENNKLKNDEKLRKDELEMLREFQKRNQERKSREAQYVPAE
jgi:hypothetical protein